MSCFVIPGSGAGIRAFTVSTHKYSANSANTCSSAPETIDRAALRTPKPVPLEVTTDAYGQPVVCADWINLEVIAPLGILAPLPVRCRTWALVCAAKLSSFSRSSLPMKLSGNVMIWFMPALCMLRVGIGKQPFAVHLPHRREVFDSNAIVPYKTAFLESITSFHIAQRLALRDVQV